MSSEPVADGEIASDITDLVPHARHVHPAELRAGDLLFDTAGSLHAIVAATDFRDGKIVCARLANDHRVWLWNGDPIVAILRRDEPPRITLHQRVFDPYDEAGWAAGDPRVRDTETDTLVWGPDDGNPIGWALGVLESHGTLEPSSSPPFTERTWYSGSGVDFARSGATVDISAHLSGFTRAEMGQIGTRLAAPRPARRTAPASRQMQQEIVRATAIGRRPPLRGAQAGRSR